MVSSIAIAAAKALSLKKKPRLIDELAESSQPESEPKQVPKNYGGDTRRFRASVAPQSPVVLPPTISKSELGLSWSFRSPNSRSLPIDRRLRFFAY